jgi:replicative DNA helicase
MAAGSKVVLPVGVPEPQALGDVVNDLDRRLREGRLEDYLPVPTGFKPLDEYLGGVLHAEDLALIGGMQNVGKTVAVLQIVRNIAGSGRALAIVVCYVHSPLYLLHRLL